MKNRIFRWGRRLLAMVLLFAMLLSCCSCSHAWLLFDILLSGGGGTIPQDSYGDSLAEQWLIPAKVDEETRAALRPDYDLGNCKALAGRVAVILFYMDDFESSWTREEADAFTENEIEPALAFLEEQAARYGVSLQLEIKQSHVYSYYDKTVDTNGERGNDATIDALKQAARGLDMATDFDLHYTILDLYGVDEVIYLTIFNKNGSTTALNPKRESDLTMIEHSIVFAHDQNSNHTEPVGSQASLIAFSVLFLYGAEKLYNNDFKRNYSYYLFPNDVMYDQPYSIEGCEIGDATAFYIGWLHDPPAIVVEDEWRGIITDEADDPI